MIHKLRITLSIVFFLLCFIGFSFFLKKWDDVRIIPIDLLTFPNKPLIDLVVESQKITVLLDIGSSATLGLHTSVMDKVQNKEFVRSSTLNDLKGDVYRIEEYTIPSIRVQSNVYENILVYDETPEHATQGGLLCGLEKSLGPIRGVIGRPFFSEWCSLFDCAHGRVLLARDIDSLKRHTDLSSLTPIPFEPHYQGILLSLSTDLGLKRLILDTGATACLMKTSSIKEDLIKDIGAPLNSTRHLLSIITEKNSVPSLFGFMRCVLRRISMAFWESIFFTSTRYSSISNIPSSI